MQRYSIIPNEIKKNKDLSAIEKLLLITVLDFDRNGVRCNAGNEFFANEIGASKVSAQRAIDVLVAKGFLVKETSRSSHGARTMRVLTCSPSIKMTLADTHFDTRRVSKSDIPEYQNDTVIVLSNNTSINNKTNKQTCDVLPEYQNDTREVLEKQNCSPLARTNPGMRTRCPLVQYPLLSLTSDEQTSAQELFKQSDINTKKKIELVLMSASAVAEEKRIPERSFAYIRLAVQDILRLKKAVRDSESSNKNQTPARPERKVYKRQFSAN